MKSSVFATGYELIIAVVRQTVSTVPRAVHFENSGTGGIETHPFCGQP